MEELEQEADNVRDIINTKEYEISVKEEEVNKLKRLIELETSEKEIEIKRIRQEIEEQKQVIDNQTKIIQELQVLNDFTQQDMTKASKDLQRKLQERQDLQLRFNDYDQEATNLRFKQSTLEEQFNKYRISHSLASAKPISESVSPRDSANKKSHSRTRSQLAIFSKE